MHNGGILVPPTEGSSHVQLWDETWRRIERFLPGMQAELFPPPPPPVEESIQESDEGRQSTATPVIDEQAESPEDGPRPDDVD